MRINTNTAALNANNRLNANSLNLGKSLEKLSSGSRINRAADDAAGLVISQGLKAQISGLSQASRNAQDGISVVQIAEGALQEVHTMLNRMRDLSVQAANTATNDTAARTAAAAEVTQLTAEIDRIAGTTSFGQLNLLNGSFGKTAGVRTGFDADNSIVVDAGDDVTVAVAGGSGALTVELNAGTYTGAQFAALVQGAARGALSASANAVDNAAAANLSVTAETVGAGAAVNFSNLGDAAVTLADGTGTPLAGFAVSPAGVIGAATGSGGTFQVGANASDTIDVTIASVTSGDLGIGGVDLINDASGALSVIDSAIATVSSTRGNLGAVQNRFESTIANLQVTTENLTASESRIRDTDYAVEMVNFTRQQILVQASTSMLAQANRLPQSVLQLLQG